MQIARKGAQSKYTCNLIAYTTRWPARVCVGMTISLAGVIVWLKYFMCIGFALPVQTNRLICILSMKTKAETMETAGHGAYVCSLSRSLS